MIQDVNLGMGENRWQRYLTHELKRDPTTVYQGLVNPMEPSAWKLVQSLILIDLWAGTDPWCPAVTIDLAQFPIMLDSLRRADIPRSIGSPSPPQVNLYHKYVSGSCLNYNPLCGRTSLGIQLETCSVLWRGLPVAGICNVDYQRGV